ncbi:MAG TPA: SGNH/GDSL hydrolase family protein [Bacillota bacterium]
MNKKTVIICISLLLSIVMFVIVQHQQTPDPLTIEQEVEQDIEDEKHTEERDDEVGEKEEVDDSPLMSMLTEAVQSTIHFFTQKETKIVAIGDSLTQGVGDSTERGGFVGILDRTINREEKLAHFENYGKKGDRTDQLIERLDSTDIQASIREADIVLITIGANDIMQVVKENITNLTYEPFSEARKLYETRLHSLFNTLKNINKDANIYLVGFYNPFAKYFPQIKELEAIVTDWNETSEQVTQEFHRVTYIPTDDLFKETDEELFAEDNFHPNTVGYHRIAQRVLDYLIAEER